MFAWGTRAADQRANRASDVGSGPQTGMMDTAGLASGLVAGTRVATAQGWRPAELVVAGDRVLTFDAGMQTVCDVSRGPLWPAGAECPRHMWPLLVPPGAIGNAQPLTVLPEQAVVFENDVGEEVYGDPFSLVPGAAFAGFRGIVAVAPEEISGPLNPLEVVTLHFGSDQIVFSAPGVLFHCPAAHAQTVAELIGLDGGYRVLAVEDARFLLNCLETDERNAAERAARIAARKRPGAAA